MCQRAVCSTCKKITYTGCGNHIEQVLAGVPAARRCTCEPKSAPRRKSWWPFGRG